MTREQIEKAAEDYSVEKSPGLGDGFFDIYQIADAFEDGAQWRINSVWHYDLDKVQTRRKVLVVFTYNRIRIYDDIRDIKGLEDLFVCFAYVDDLLPGRKEEVK